MVSHSVTCPAFIQTKTIISSNPGLTSRRLLLSLSFDTLGRLFVAVPDKVLEDLGAVLVVPDQLTRATNMERGIRADTPKIDQTIDSYKYIYI